MSGLRKGLNAAESHAARGVSKCKGYDRWRAFLGGYGASGYIGEFADRADAIAARVKAEIELFGCEFADPAIVVDGAVARIPLIARHGRLTGHALIDVDDVVKVEGLWWRQSRDYAVAFPLRKMTYLHRLLIPGFPTVDHISGDGLDNRKANLRGCTHAENCRNTKIRSDNSTGFKGVRVTAEGRFNARIFLDGQHHHIGNYDTPEDAARAYDAEALSRFGEFARLNSQLVRAA